MTVLLLTGFLATILMRVLKNDFIKFSRDDEAGPCLMLSGHYLLSQLAIQIPTSMCMLRHSYGGNDAGEPGRS